jgi:glycosyltransferase involved in cell wall biosynthesis
MKVVMINDCAYVGETILKFLEGVEWLHIKRSRSIWDKTFGVAYGILRAKGDVYHVNYLLQDCYIALKLGKRPLIGHAHGSDLRSGLKHPLLKRIVQYDLKRCVRVLVSTPDILGIAKMFREDAEYLPNPVDTRLFYPKPMPERDGRLRVLIASNSDWKVKGTDMAIRALSKIKDEVEVSIIRYGKDFDKTVELARSLGLNLHVLEKVSHEEIREYYWSNDIIIDQFKLGSLGMISLEAIACGRPVVTFVSSEYVDYYREFPLWDVDTEEKIVKAILTADERLWQQEYAYLIRHHNPQIIVKKLLDVYGEIS